MAIKFMAWNVRHFHGNKPVRFEDVKNMINRFTPDVFVLIEFQGKDQVRSLMLEYDKYDFGVTDSRQKLEMLIGWKRSKFQQAIFTQRREFFVGNLFLRPGGLLSVRRAGKFYNFLCLHTDSGATPEDYTNRREMFKKVMSLNNHLRGLSAQNGASRLIAIGDLNTMGNGNTIDGDEELEKLKSRAIDNNMTLLSKDRPETWHQHAKGRRREPIVLADLQTAMKSNLDHAVADNHLTLKKRGDNTDNFIHVEGWNQLAGQDRLDFVLELSDHPALVGEIIE